MQSKINRNRRLPTLPVLLGYCGLLSNGKYMPMGSVCDVPVLEINAKGDESRITLC